MRSVQGHCIYIHMRTVNTFMRLYKNAEKKNPSGLKTQKIFVKVDTSF